MRISTRFSAALCATILSLWSSSAFAAGLRSIVPGHTGAGASGCRASAKYGFLYVERHAVQLLNQVDIYPLPLKHHPQACGTIVPPTHEQSREIDCMAVDPSDGHLFMLTGAFDSKTPEILQFASPSHGSTYIGALKGPATGLIGGSDDGMTFFNGALWIADQGNPQQSTLREYSSYIGNVPPSYVLGGSTFLGDISTAPLEAPYTTPSLYTSSPEALYAWNGISLNLVTTFGDGDDFSIAAIPNSPFVVVTDFGGMELWQFSGSSITRVQYYSEGTRHPDQVIANTYNPADPTLYVTSFSRAPAVWEYTIASGTKPSITFREKVRIPGLVPLLALGGP